VKVNNSSDIGARGFRTTRWSEVLLSAQAQAAGSEEALAELCKLYWYPLYGYVRRRGYTAEDAQDLTQGFFLDLLGRKALRQATPVRGKFRSFLLASLQNYLADQLDRERTIKRGGQVQFIPLDRLRGEARYQLELADGLTPEKIFVARWAMTLIEETLRQLRLEYESQGKTAITEILEPFLDPANSQRLPSYEEAAAKLEVTVGAVKVLIHRMRKRHHALLRGEVGRTVASSLEINDEIHALCEAFIAAQGYLDS
jgi:RNA polymerase sigma factor (sigma-70 family)